MPTYRAAPARSKPRRRRYISDDELDGTTAGDEDGPRPLSRGADLAALLRDTEPLYAQSHYRHRALLQPGSGDMAAPADADVAAAEGLMALDLRSLAESLAALPIGELLGVRDEYVLEEGGLESPVTWAAGAAPGA
ncbi:hypothetical protein MNEG_9476, partial [Monoraphidium neglectum]